jgi:two-component system, NtrC family, sensor kinase
MSARVVIVDDSLTVRMDLGDSFGEAGFEAVLCSTVAEARRALERTTDLVVLDVVLPDGDGVELLRSLRGDARTAELPILMLSSEDEIADRIRGLETGADAYVGKPYDAAYVLAKARTLVRTVRGERARPTILIIDDSPTFRAELARHLREAGYDIVLAESGEEGLKRAAETTPDAIVVDGVMPGMDGTTVVRHVRLDPALRATPCVLLTASENAAGEIEALDAGADAYARKSEPLELVVARLAAVMRSASSSLASSALEGLLAPKKVLAVDDSTTYLGELSERLREDGYEVVKATSGEAALELLSVESFDCILLDLMMPGLSGHDTCRRIKAAPALRSVPLIMLTALEDQDAMIRGINAGADDYVAKSHEFEVLKARLRAQLRRKQFEDENRTVREQILNQEAETRAARELAETRSALLEQLSMKNEELRSLNQELATFAYSVSHDLRQPLRSVRGFSRTVLERYGEQFDGEAKHYLERIRAGAERMNELIDGLLVLSRVTRKPLHMQPLQLHAIARRVFERLREGEPARRAELAMPEPIDAFGDPQLIESVLENLIGNAWKFTSRCETAHIEVGIDREGAYFVKDDGVGFPMDYADKLFAPFMRLHTEKDFEGTGIGLATVQRIVRRHGGRIWARSAPDEGATFYFTLGDRGGPA